jgi:hypothetical protein
MRKSELTRRKDLTDLRLAERGSCKPRAKSLGVLSFGRGFAMPGKFVCSSGSMKAHGLS